MGLRALATVSRLGLALALSSHAGNAQNLVPGTYRTDARMVLVPFTVTDHYGKTVNGLRARDFSVFDDQSQQPIISFATEDAPCSMGLVLDISGSMRYALGTAKNVAQAFLETANPEDEFLMLTVSSVPDAAPAFTTDTDVLQQQIRAVRSGGMTALNDTVYLALNRMREARQPRRALVIFSDGVDNNSRYSERELMRAALEADVQVYTILVDGLPGSASGSMVPFRPTMILKPGQQAVAQQKPLMIQELSEKTGGLHFHIRKESEATAAAAQIGLALRNQYVIGYHAPESVISGNVLSGKWHHIRVKTSVPKVHVYARAGYYAR